MRSSSLDVYRYAECPSGFRVFLLEAEPGRHFLRNERVVQRFIIPLRLMENPNPLLDGKKVLEIGDIMSILPHRYPFLLIDRIVEIERAKRIVAIKNVTINEPFFQGHFPGYPIMPGVLMVESIAQAGGTLLLTEIPDRESKLMVFTGIERAKFRKQVVPGDQLRIEIDVLNWKPRAVRMQGKCTVEGKLACEAIVMCQLVPRQRPSEPASESAPESTREPEQVLEPVSHE